MSIWKSIATLWEWARAVLWFTSFAFCLLLLVIGVLAYLPGVPRVDYPAWLFVIIGLIGTIWLASSTYFEAMIESRPVQLAGRGLLLVWQLVAVPVETLYWLTWLAIGVEFAHLWMTQANVFAQPMTFATLWLAFGLLALISNGLKIVGLYTVFLFYEQMNAAPLRFLSNFPSVVDQNLSLFRAEMGIQAQWFDAGSGIVMATLVVIAIAMLSTTTVTALATARGIYTGAQHTVSVIVGSVFSMTTFAVLLGGVAILFFGVKVFHFLEYLGEVSMAVDRDLVSFVFALMLVPILDLILWWPMSKTPTVSRWIRRRAAGQAK